jgi:uncharacterized membrane protein YeaQ/YmgE (transglycosylase-associated protein family)
MVLTIPRLNCSAVTARALRRPSETPIASIAFNTEGDGMNMLSLIVQLISGAVGGNVAGSLMKKFDLGPVGNSIAGIVGGGLGGQLLNMLAAGAGAAAPAAGSMDAGSIVSSVLGGGVGGGVLMAIIGMIRSSMKQPG